MRASVEASLVQADALLAELHSSNAKARQARLRCQAEIQDPVGLQQALDEHRIEGLRPWLTTLRETAAHGNWAAARVGLDRWLAIASEYRVAVCAARVANCAPLEQRDALVGLLRARRAQSRDLARRGVYLMPEAEEDARQASTLASEPPCCLSELQLRIARFDAAVSALARASRQPPVPG